MDTNITTPASAAYNHLLDLTDFFGPVIDTYTREQAIEDGTLVQAPAKMVREAGIALPVAFTRAAWEEMVTWTEADSERQVPQDETGRLWDVLWIARHAMARSASTDRVDFKVYRVRRGGRAVTARPVWLALVLGGGDEGEPVLTIMLPSES